MTGPETALRPPAVLETSFWTAGHRAEVVANLFDFFMLVIPGPVEAEIMARPLGAPAPREYPYQTLFRQLRQRMHAAPSETPLPLRVFGPGEAAAISLALHLRDRGEPVTLLANEHRASEYARNLGLAVLTVPSFVVVLRSRRIISDAAARRKLQLLQAITSPAYLDQARRLLDHLTDLS